MKAFRCFCITSKEWCRCFFYVEKRMESKEVIKRKIENLEKALKKTIFKKSLKIDLLFLIYEEDLGSLSYYSTICSSLEILSAST